MRELEEQGADEVRRGVDREVEEDPEGVEDEGGVSKRGVASALIGEGRRRTESC